jgi:hypothetical protein
MANKDVLVLGLAVTVGGLAAAALLPMAVAAADDCALGDCSLVSGGAPTNEWYGGIRPFFADWKQNQLVDVDVTKDGVTSVAGTYNVAEQDYASPQLDLSEYQYGTFTPAGTASGVDTDGLSGAQVYDLTLGPGTVVDGQTLYQMNDLNVVYGNGDQTEILTIPGHYTDYMIVGPDGGSADWIQYWGSSTVQTMWDSIGTPTFPAALLHDLPANVLPPDVWFPDITSAVPTI